VVEAAAGTSGHLPAAALPAEVEVEVVAVQAGRYSVRAVR